MIGLAAAAATAAGAATAAAAAAALVSTLEGQNWIRFKTKISTQSLIYGKWRPEGRGALKFGRKMSKIQ